jgi:hypothetical protein
MSPKRQPKSTTRPATSFCSAMPLCKQRSGTSEANRSFKMR